jgi:hypothetical protein
MSLIPNDVVYLCVTRWKSLLLACKQQQRERRHLEPRSSGAGRVCLRVCLLSDRAPRPQQSPHRRTLLYSCEAEAATQRQKTNEYVKSSLLIGRDDSGG